MQTVATPYGITLTYTASPQVYAYYQNQPEAESVFPANAALLLGLVENTDTVHFAISDGVNSFTRSYQRQALEQHIGARLNSLTQTQTTFEAFLDDLYTPYWPQAIYAQAQLQTGVI